MKVSVEKLPTSEAVLNVDVTWDDMEKASDKAYRKLVQKVDIQGFRRGKAPRTILERRVGKEYIYQEGLDDLISEAYRDALKEHDLTPITQPTVDAPVFEMGQPYHFSLTVPIITPVELADYTAMHFDREELGVTSEEVDKELESLQNRQSNWETVERAAEYGDRIKADLKLTSGEQKISDLKDNTFEITNERHGLFTGMDEHLIGLKAGDSKSFTTTIPADYSNEKLAGKEAAYEVTVHSVETKQSPALDDAFAAKVSDGQYETLEELSKGLSDNILESKKRSSNETLRENAINALIEQSTFTIHPVLIEQEVEEMAHQFGHMLEQQHLSFDQYLTMTRKSRAEFMEENRPEAEKRVKRQLVLEELARRENITVLPEEIEALFNAYAQIGQELPQTEEQIRSLMISYRREKTLSRLIELTTDPDPDAETEEESAEEATIANAEAAALATNASLEDVQTEESANTTAHAADAKTESVE
ncbi:trigger factor [Tengunoibacter tsumagoiensis]|uniref:Trigger factor n=1 Tax=Tengunoibacter tsumagoiensis TaxID=2014871 RepID=A0A401ZUL3_9CHLR|nr:trigger factor [Tengunoibacter tsumagoiensis]GCE10476.1 trigger factor [Tengunoibacter tsumagoiensis]